MATYAQRRQWQREESAKRQALRSLRNAINKALKASGVPHSHEYTMPVSGITNTKGWQTESDIFSNVVTVRLHKGADEEAVKAALAGFEYKLNEERYEVSGAKDGTCKIDQR